jgi:hypothetical protein
MVHRRVIDGEEVVFGVQGGLWGNAMTWWDHDTGSVWSQPIGEAIAGPRKGTVLELLPSTLSRWGAWRDAHPDTLALDAPGDRAGFDLDDMAIVVDFAGDSLAVAVPDLREHGVANDVVAGVEVAIVLDPAGGERWSVLHRRVGDRSLTLEVIAGALRDVETGTVWDPVRGRGLDGPLAGEFLDPLPGFTVFPGDYRTFFPTGRVWGEDGADAPSP